MTRKALLELVRHRVKSTDSTEQFPIQYIEAICDTVWASFSSEAVNLKTQDMNFFTKKYPAVTVDYDEDSEYFSLTLPEQILKLNRVGDGVISINQLNSIDNDFKPISEKNFRLSKGQEVNRTGADIYFFVTYDTVQFNQSMTDAIADVGVDLRLSIPFSAYLLTEELPLPVGKEMEFVGAVVGMIQGTPDTGLINKNTNE
jgi:hypothetical protein